MAFVFTECDFIPVFFMFLHSLILILFFAEFHIIYFWGCAGISERSTVTVEAILKYQLIGDLENPGCNHWTWSGKLRILKKPINVLTVLATGILWEKDLAPKSHPFPRRFLESLSPHSQKTAWWRHDWWPLCWKMLIVFVKNGWRFPRTWWNFGWWKLILHPGFIPLFAKWMVVKST